MGYYETRIKELNKSSNNSTSDSYFDRRKKEIEQEQKVEAISTQDRIKRGSEMMQRQQNMLGFMGGKQPNSDYIKFGPQINTTQKQALPSKNSSDLPYVQTYKEVPVNFASGNILGGIGNALKGTGQMVLQGIQTPQTLVLNASKAIIDTAKGKKTTFDPTLSSDKYLQETGNEKTDKFYNSLPGKFTSGVFGMASDPLTWVGGGGIADEALKAGAKGTKGLIEDAKISENILNKQALNNAKASIAENALKPKLNTSLKDSINTLPVAEKQSSIANKAIESTKLFSLPDTEEELTKLVTDLDNKRRNGVKINLQLFGEAQAKLEKIKASRFKTNTIERSTLIPNEIKKQLNPDDFDYITETSKDWQEKALQNITQNKEKVINDIKNSNSISGGVQAHEAAAITSDLLNEVRKTNDPTALKSWLKTVAEKTRETARALKGTDTAWDKKSAEGALTDAQRVVDKIEKDIEKSNPKLIEEINKESKRRVKEFTDLGETVDPEKIRDIVKKEYGVPTLEDEDIKYIIDNMDKAKSLIEGSYEQRVLHAKVAKRIADKIPSTFGEKFQAAQRISMLLNPKTTVIRNPLGNALLGTLESAKNVIATPIDMATSAIRKSERTTTIAPFTKGKASFQGASKGIKEWALDIKNGIDTNPTGAQVELPKKKIFNESAKIPVMRTVNKAANNIHGLVGRMLSIGDRPFYEAAYNSRLAELKKLKNTNIVTESMEEEAKLHAFERTLQNDSAMAEMFTGLKKGNFISDKHPEAKAAYQFVANLVMPFAKTPANILDKFIDYSPLGAVKATTKAIKTAGKGTFNQKKFVDTMARSLTGTGLAAVGYLMAKNGLVTGARDPDNKVASLETAIGKQNYAFKIGDTYYTFDWALPAAAPIAMGADIYNAISKRKEGQNAALKGTESAVNLLFNSTLLKGPSGFTGGYSPAVALGQGLLGTTTQVTPTAGKQIAQLIDPYQRETYDPNKLKQTLNKTVARIPFASKTLPSKVDVFGNDVKAFQGKNNVWNVMFNPGFSSTYKPDETQKEIIRLYEDAGTTDQLPAVAEKSIAATKQYPRINLTQSEYIKYQKLMGKYTMERFKDVMKTSAYINATDTKELTADEVRAKMLGDIVSKAKKEAKKEILASRGYKVK